MRNVWDVVDYDIDALVLFRGKFVRFWDLTDEEYEEYFSKGKEEEAQDEG